MVAVSVLTGLLVDFFGSWDYAHAMGWAAESRTFLWWVWAIIAQLDPAGTAVHANREDPGQTSSDVLVLATTMSSFGGVVLILMTAGSTQGGMKAGNLGLALGRVALSRILVHTLFTLRYARLFYKNRAPTREQNAPTKPRRTTFVLDRA